MITDGLTPKQLGLLAALTCDADIQAACAAAKVSRTTAYRWMKEPAFLNELARQRDAAFSAALDSVKTQAARAVSELTGLLGAKDDRLRRLVCNDLLAHAMKVRELEDFEKRLTVLEKAMTGKGKGGEA
jgi:hypothetical protein